MTAAICVWLERLPSGLGVGDQPPEFDQVPPRRRERVSTLKINWGCFKSLHIWISKQIRKSLHSPEPPAHYLGLASFALPGLQMCSLKHSGCRVLNGKPDSAGAFGTWNLDMRPRMLKASRAYSTVLRGAWQAWSAPPPPPRAHKCLPGPALAARPDPSILGSTHYLQKFPECEQVQACPESK